jgi:hypothetical protein
MYTLFFPFNILQIYDYFIDSGIEYEHESIVLAPVKVGIDGGSFTLT